MRLARVADEALQREALDAVEELAEGVHQRQDSIQEPDGTRQRGGGAWQAKCVRLAELAPRVAPRLRPELHRVWRGTLHELAAGGRGQFFFELVNLVAVIEALGDTEALATTARGLVAVGLWWR